MSILKLNQTRELDVRIPFTLSLFGLLLLGTNGNADDIDVQVDIVVPDGIAVRMTSVSAGMEGR